MGQVRGLLKECNVDISEICMNMYTIEDQHKFNTLEEVLKATENLRAVVNRIKSKNGNKSKVDVYISVLDGNNSEGKYEYTTSKRYGGKKYFNGILKTPALPHWHIVVKGEGASSLCTYIITYLSIIYPGYTFRKRHLKELEDRNKFLEYVKRQSIYVRRF